MYSSHNQARIQTFNLNSNYSVSCVDLDVVDPFSGSGTVHWQRLKMNSIVMKKVMMMKGVIMTRSLLQWWIDNDFVTLIAYYFFFSTSCCVFKIGSTSFSFVGLNHPWMRYWIVTVVVAYRQRSDPRYSIFVALCYSVNLGLACFCVYSSLSKFDYIF